MDTGSVVAIGRDLSRAFRERPALVVGAGVLGLIGISLLNRGQAADEGEVVDPLAGLFPGVDTWGGSIPGSGSVPWPGYPGAGDGSYVDPGYYVDPGPIAPTPVAPYQPPSYTPSPGPGSPSPSSPAASGGSSDGATVTDLLGNAVSWATYQAEKLGLIAAAGPNAPYSEINRQLVDKYGGTIYPGQGPEENLTNQQYNDLVLGGALGPSGQALVLSSPNVGMNTVDPATGKSGYQAWYEYLVRVGPSGYVSPQGVNDQAEYYRNLEIARANAQAGTAVSPGFATPPLPSPPAPQPPRPVVDNSARRAQLQAALATNARNIAVYQAIPANQRTAAQNAALQTNLNTRAAMQAELARL